MSIKNFKFRVYPNKEQKERIDFLFGSCRFIHNRFLSEHKELLIKYKETKDKVYKYRMSVKNQEEKLNELLEKEDTKWLKEASRYNLEKTIKDLVKSVRSFNNHKRKYPKLKLKSQKQILKFNTVDFSILEDRLFVTDIKSLLKVKITREIEESKIVNCLLMKEITGKYFISFRVMTDRKILSGNKITGIDVGIKNLCTFSDGEKIENPKVFKSFSKSIIKLNRQLSKKIKKSNNYEKCRIKLARKHEKIRNKRLDFFHKLTNRIVKENRIIVIENLRIKNLVRNKKLSKYILDAGWGIFKNVLTYKVNESTQSKLYLADPYFPSTQLCSGCGKKPMSHIKLGTTSWTCVRCGTLHDRDINAAKNLEQLGRKHDAFLIKKDSSVFLIPSIK